MLFCTECGCVEVTATQTLCQAGKATKLKCISFNMNVNLCCIIADPGKYHKSCLLLHIWLQTTQIVSFAELMNLSLIPLDSWWNLFYRETLVCFVLKAPGIRGVTLRRDSATWSRAQRPPQDGSEQLRLQDSTMTTPTTHQVSLSYFRDIAILNSQPPLLIHAAPPPSPL